MVIAILTAKERKMADWKGLDSGGTEQIWAPNIIVGALEIFRRHQPYNRHQTDSPIFDELENKFPNITWRNFNRDGSFRPIFRKSNPWKKLDLVASLTNKNEVVTPKGEDVIKGISSVQNCFMSAARDHIENDGTRSFAIICSWVISNPSKIISLGDIGAKIDGNNSYAQKKIGTSSLSEGKTSSTRHRRLRGMLNVLISAGALAEISDNLWGVADEEVISFIVGDFDDELETSVDGVRSARTSKIDKSPSFKLRPWSGGRTIRMSERGINAESNPEQRRNLLDKANSIHQSLVDQIASVIVAQNGRPFEDYNSVDICVSDIAKIIFEVKSLTVNNATDQMRKAVSQLYEYRWRFRDKFGPETTLCITTDIDPRTLLDDDFIQYLIEDRKVILLWRDSSRLISHNDRFLEEILTLDH